MIFGTEMPELPYLIEKLLPQVLGILIIAAGFLVGFIIKTVVVLILNQGMFKGIVNHGIVQKIFIAIGLDKVSFANVIGEILRWWSISFSLFFAAKTAELPNMEDVIGPILDYIPHIILAIIILVVGIRISDIISNLIAGAMHFSKKRFLHMLAFFSKTSILIFTSLLALAELGVDKDLIIIIFIGFISMASLAGGLAFGLGGKTLAEELLREFMNYRHSKTEIKKEK
jgi:hypothetical protein